MSEIAFAPFYERWAAKPGIGAVGKLILAGCVALAFFLPYYGRVGAAALSNWSWLLAVLIFCALLFLFYATATLRHLFPIWQVHIEKGNAAAFLVPLNRYLCDRNFFLAGFFFGGANLTMGVLFGIDMSDPVAASLLLFGYFIAGFVCGLPAMGILGVVATFRKFTESNTLKLDYTAPDRCGGLSFFGVALVKFSIVTLLAGILIASYILLAEWSHAGNPWVQLLMWGWILFPFLLSLLVLVVPALDINQMLSRYRHVEEQKLKDKCSELRCRIEVNAVGGELESLRSDYDYLCRRREEVHNMRTWPFSAGATTSFVGAFLSNVLVAIELGRSLLSNN
ncbi:hypothetical protein DESUT3_19180 [Desulfuromonas versatilis]|uniref:Uncharacterized protein n=1 Tax=Desulfuromonas versatilis TaxID=2802975 RepID=A0ABN6E061_9BACT|nr:hypothetical protein [Desulfuromonas versatilis]BCR04849.1 hypothetical protein DESUT3_19180 [Desulfuromonas versatilis]